MTCCICIELIQYINGIIIATEPLAHYCYAYWALKNGLHILMDKPITTREHVVSSQKQAKGLLEDYSNLLKEYNKLQREKNTIFSINVQRRFHPSYKKVFSLLKQVRDKFNAPVTSIQSMHSDGQWRMPNEIVTQLYHSYFQGYGKCSHSGYHIFDIASVFYKYGTPSLKYADTVEVESSFITPNGFIKQFNEEDYNNYFNKDEYLKTRILNDRKLKKIYENYGELDAYNLIRLKKDNVPICNISINLMHNTFSRRTWLKPGSDLYKGNGRVKQELHIINQGPFQTIQMHTYQSNDKHDINTKDDLNVGGNNHCDIYVFRNAGIFDENTLPFRKYSMADVIKNADWSKLLYEEKKAKVIEEFCDFMIGAKQKKDLLSNIDSHGFGVKIMSSVYQSNIQYNKHGNPLVSFKIDKNDL